MLEDMMDGKSWNSNSIQKSIMANHEPNEEGVYPDWADKQYVFKYPEVKIVNLFEIHRDAAIHWFQNGHPMKSWITNSEEMLGVSEKQAEKCRGWYKIKRQETSALWAQRQDIRKGEGISLTLRELCEKVAAAVKAKRARKAKTRTNETYLKMSQKAT